MAWRYRKRVKVAPGVYMNISKNGISTSVGVRGASMTFGNNGTYLNTGIPGTGFYSRQRIGGPATPRVHYSTPSTPQIHSKGTYTFTGILCAIAAITCLALAPIGLIGTFVFAAGTWANFSNRKKYYGKSASNNSPSFIADAKGALALSTDERKKRILANFIATVETIDAIEDEELILESLKKRPQKNADLITSHNADLEALKTKLSATEYNVDSSVPTKVLALYENVCQSFEQLLTSHKIWIETSRIQNTERKASALSLIDRKETTLGVGVFNYIKSKYDVPAIPFGSHILYLYPEFAILSQSPSQFEIIDYSSILVAYTTTNFQESGSYPSDAEIIGSTWRYVNKNGGPDRRYANNPSIPVLKYGIISISVRNHGSVNFQISNAVLANAFCSNFNRFANTIESKNPVNKDAGTTSSHQDVTYSLDDIILASDKLFKCLVDMSNDRQVLDAFDNQKQLDKARTLSIGGHEVDPRLACVAAADLIKCFEGLGHKADMNTEEGLALGIILSRIMMPDNPAWCNKSIMRSAKGRDALNSAYNVFKKNIQLDLDPEKFFLIELFRHEGVDEETINKWAVLLHRYALLIAKADGALSDTEQRWLTNILSFTQNGATRTTTYRTTSKNITLPPDLDPLFEQAARFAVSIHQFSCSAIQRHFNIGYSRAGKIIDQLESLGIVGSAQSGKPRKVLIDSHALEELLSTGTCTIETIEEVPASNAETAASPKGKEISNPLKELEDMIGLSGVKAEVSSVYNLVKIQKMRAAKGLNAPDISYHCVFTGNPGTGKTTVARLVAQIYKQLGILSKGHLVETDRSGLVAEYVGQTAVKTNKIIDSALDGVLFIDEAYSLVQNGGANDFGLEAIATLLKRMEDNRDRLVVILAGYSEEMKQFIDSNPGLQSRFNRYIHFEDYTADELISIFEYNLAKYDYRMTPGARLALGEKMEKAVAGKDKNFGNARFVRNFFEKTLEKQAKRLASSLSSLSENALIEITEDDIR